MVENQNAQPPGGGGQWEGEPSTTFVVLPLQAGHRGEPEAGQMRLPEAPGPDQAVQTTERVCRGKRSPRNQQLPHLLICAPKAFTNRNLLESSETNHQLFQKEFSRRGNKDKNSKKEKKILDVFHRLL